MIAIIFILMMIVLFAMNPEMLILIGVIAAGLAIWLGKAFLEDLWDQKKAEAKKRKGTRAEKQINRRKQLVIATAVCWAVGCAVFGISILIQSRWFPPLLDYFTANYPNSPMKEPQYYLSIPVYTPVFWLAFTIPYIVTSLIVRKGEKKGILAATILFLLNGFFAAVAANDLPYERLACIALTILPVLTIWQLLRYGKLFPSIAALAGEVIEDGPVSRAVILFPKPKSIYLEGLPSYLVFCGCLVLCVESMTLWVPCGIFGIVILVNIARKGSLTHKHKDYIKILLPRHWPTDCIYANYKDGLVGADHREKRIEELQKLVSDMEYYGLHGTEKRVRMLEGLRNKCWAKAAKCRGAASSAPGLFMERERDWSIAGGIASGIAGPAAGVAAALDVQAQNAEIRARNKENASLAVGTMMFMSEQAKRHDEQADFYDSLIPKARNKKILSTDTQKVFQQLVITGAVASASETGAVTVEANFEKKKDCDFDTIDGTVAARLYRNGNLEASAYFVLPVYGIDRKTKLSVISTKPTTPHASYTVKFEPVDLWAME